MAHSVQRRPAALDIESQQEPLLLNSDESDPADEGASSSRPFTVVDVAKNTTQDHGQLDSFRNVEDNIEQPMRGTNYNDTTPWYQDDNPLKRYPAIVVKRLWQIFEEIAARTPDGVRIVAAPFLMVIGAALFVIGCIPLLVVYLMHYLFEGVMRIVYVPIMFPLPSWVVAFILTNVFLYLGIVNGNFPLIPLISEGFLVTWAAVLGKCIRRGYPVIESGVTT